MSFQFTVCKQRMAKAPHVDFEADTVRMMIVMTSCTVTNSGQQDILTISGLTVPDEMDGANYVRKTVTGAAISAIDTVLHDISFTCDPKTWTALGAGSRQMKGIIFYKDPTGLDDDTTNIPLIFIDGGFPQPATGAPFTYTPDAGGVFKW